MAALCTRGATRYVTEVIREADVQAGLSRDFLPRVLDTILGGLEQAAKTLGGMVP